MPEYFIALISQYTGSLNKDQSERYAKSVIDSWFYSSSESAKKELLSVLPDYLKPQKKLFHSIIRPSINPNQDQIFINRLMAELAKTDQQEAEQIISGVFKTLKIISSQKDKFKYHSNLSGQKVKNIFLKA